MPSVFAKYIDNPKNERPKTAQASQRGDPIADRIASTILRALRQTRPKGLSRRKIYGMFYRNYSAATLDAAFDRLWQDGKARREQKVRTAPGSGRPAEMWFATQHD